jgi:hypothetical protein
MMRDPPESDARRVVRLAQEATARLRALRRLRHMLSKRDTYADIERWCTDWESGRRGVQLRDLSATSSQALLDELLRRACPTYDPHELPDLDIVLVGVASGGVALPDLGVSAWPGALAIDCDPGTNWSTETATGFLGLVADLTALAGDGVTLVLVDEHAEPLPERDQERFRSALPQRKTGDVGA